MKVTLHQLTNAFRLALGLALAWTMLAQPALAQKKKSSPAKPDLNGLVEASFGTFKTTGMSVAVVKDGQVVLSRGLGLADASKNTPATSASLYNIASCTKAFTAAALALLVEQGKLRWEDKVVDHIPDFQLSDPWVTSQMTVKELLCHRSGLGTFDGDLLWYGTSYSDAEIVAHMRHLPLRQEFRSDFGYQNNMYTIAGMIVQKLTGKTWSQFISDRFFAPLEMTHSRPSNDELQAGDPIAYGHINGKPLPVYDYTGGKPAASIYASVDDVSHWIKMWLDGGKYAGQQILDPKSIRTLHSQQTNINISPNWESWGIHFRSYALGWTTFDYAGIKVVEHNGGMPGYISKVTLAPELGLGFVILNNGNDGVVNEALRFKLLDHYTDHKGQDWDKVFKTFADMGAMGEAAETKAREDSRVPNTQPSLAAKAYAGTYHDPTYGDVVVSEREGGLHFSMIPTKELFSGQMQHFHYDTWRVQFADPYLPFALVTFTIGPKADVQGFKIDLPNGDFHFWQLDFKRKGN